MVAGEPVAGKNPAAGASHEANSGEGSGEWSPNLEPSLQVLLETQLTRFEGLKGMYHIARHRIVMKDNEPIKQRYYPNPAMQRIIDEQVEKLLRTGAVPKPAQCADCSGEKEGRMEGELKEKKNGECASIIGSLMHIAH